MSGSTFFKLLDAGHEWVPSRLGHGETMCARCLITNREAAVLGLMGRCSAPTGGGPAREKEEPDAG